MPEKQKRRRRSRRDASRGPSAPTADLLTVKEAAAFLRIHETTMRRLLDRGALTKVRVGARVRVQRVELDAYVRGGGDVPAAAPGITPTMIRALHAKANQIDRANERDAGTTKRHILQAAGEHFGRAITSSTDLSAVEADWVLDRLSEAQSELPR